MDEHDPLVSPTDMLALPPAQVKIMRLMLHHRQLRYLEILDAFTSASAKERLSRLEVDQGLRALTEMKWLIREESSDGVAFRVGEISRTGALNKDREDQQERRRTGTERFAGFFDSLGESSIQRPGTRGFTEGLIRQPSEDEPPPESPPKPKIRSKMMDELGWKTESDENE